MKLLPLSRPVESLQSDEKAEFRHAVNQRLTCAHEKPLNRSSKDQRDTHKPDLIGCFYITGFIETRGSRGGVKRKQGSFGKMEELPCRNQMSYCRRDSSTKRDPCDKFLIRHIDQPVLFEPAFCARKGRTFESGPGGPGSFAVSRTADTEVEGGEGDLWFAGYDT